MPLYLFYPCKPDGSAPSFEALILASDAAATAFARNLLREHPGAASMCVWRDETEVVTVLREPEAKPAWPEAATVWLEPALSAAPARPLQARRRRSGRWLGRSGARRRELHRPWPKA